MLSAGKIKYLRLLHGVTQQEVGDFLGVSKNYISMIETAKRSYDEETHDKIINAIYAIDTEKQKQKDNPTEILKDVSSVEKNKQSKNKKNNK